MNPFLHNTVAQPLPDSQAIWRNKTSDNNATHWSKKTLKAAGIAALTWATCASAVDLNSASLGELQGVKGIGPKTAQIIIAERNRAGDYQSFSDLSDRVRGIGPKKAQTLQESGLTISKMSSVGKSETNKTTSKPK